MGSHRQGARIVAGTALVIAVAGAPAPARAHFFLVAPDSWMSQGPLGDPQKLGPCGDEAGGTATGKVTAFRPGQMIEVTVDERIFHPGHYRVALAVEDRSELPPPPIVTAVGSDPCGSAEIQDPPIFPILADDVLPHTEPFDGPRTFTVTLPSDVICTRCTLQVIEYMSHHGRPCFYHHCADISIQGDLETPTPTSTPTETRPIEPTATNTSPAAPTSTATPAPPARCGGDCDEGGSVTIDELLTLVGIALESMPIDACKAGNADGNQEIALDEIVTAVNRALRGCPPPAFESASCEMPLPEGQNPADVGCGWLTVPENRRRPGGRAIKLAVVILAATGKNPEPDPLVILSGGPGQWAIDSVLPRFSGDFAAPIQSKRDIVIFDQRGSGRSQPALNCPEVMSYRDFLGTLTTTEEDVEIDEQIFVACHDRLMEEGNDLSGYSSAATAQDIDDLMTALGYDRFNLYGLSYGTRVALTALRDQRAARIRSVVLDSVVPPQEHLVRTGRAVEQSFERLLADCAADPACNSAYPNLRQETFDLIDQLNLEPLTLTPTDPASNEPFMAIISGDRLVRLAESAFQSATLIPFLPLFVTATAGGNAALLTAALGMAAAPALYSPGVQNAVLCNEETPLIDTVRVEQERALVNPTIAHAFAYPDAYMRACPRFDLPAPAPIENEPVHSEVPVLIFAGDYDPNTPPASGRLAAETLPNSFYFEFRGFGHVVLFQQAAPTGPPACAMTVMAAFLDDPLHAPDGSCVAAIPPPHFAGS